MVYVQKHRHKFLSKIADQMFYRLVRSRPERRNVRCEQVGQAGTDGLQILKRRFGIGNRVAVAVGNCDRDRSQRLSVLVELTYRRP